MLSRRILLAFTALTVMPTLGYAAGFSTFTKSAFEKAQKDEKSISSPFTLFGAPPAKPKRPSSAHF